MRFLLVLFTVFGTACDECENSADCDVGEVCRDGSCEASGWPGAGDSDFVVPVDGNPGSQSFGGGGIDGSRADENEDAGQSPDGGVETSDETDVDTGVEWPECEGGKLDTNNKLCWEDPPPEEYVQWPVALSYCASLEDGSWRLPTIGELRSLITGCPETELDFSLTEPSVGSCGVYDACTESPCSQEVSCDGCQRSVQCHWYPDLQGSCSWYWSGTELPDEPEFAWYVDFEVGAVASVTFYSQNYVRCVREEE